MNRAARQGTLTSDHFYAHSRPKLTKIIKLTGAPDLPDSGRGGSEGGIFMSWGSADASVAPLILGTSHLQNSSLLEGNPHLF